MSGDEQQLTIVDVINSLEDNFTAIAEKDNLVTWKAEARFALQAVQKNTALQTCTIPSIKASIINVAACGLTLNPADAYAFLIPEYNTDTQQKECQLRISARGMIKGATSTGAVAWVKAEVVKEGEPFVYKGVSALPDHEINDPFNRKKKATIGAYCVARTPSGDYLVDIIDAEELCQIQQCAKTQKVWKAWPDEMAKKSIIKRAAKQWPRVEASSRLHKMIEIVNDVEGGFDLPEKQLMGNKPVDVDKVNKSEIRLRELIDEDIEEDARAKAIQGVTDELSNDELMEIWNRFGSEKLLDNPRKNKRTAIREYMGMKVEAA